MTQLKHSLHLGYSHPTTWFRAPYF